MKNTVCNENQAMIKRFVERSWQLSKCKKCNSLLHDPVKAMCGHLFCRTCIFVKVHHHTNYTETQSDCIVCQDVDSNRDIEEVSLKISRLSSCLLHFVKDFCSEGGVTVASSIGPKQSSETKLLILTEENLYSQEVNLAMESETCSGPILISGLPSPRLTSHRTLQPTQKVDQWLMTYSDEGPSTMHKEEECENSVSVKNSETLSSQSLKVSSPYLTSSSNGKELSYDIVSAPSPPPPPGEDIDHQIKRGRPRRGRGRPRKNALPISSGENFAKKRERSNSITPELKVSGIKTPISHTNISEDIDEAIASKSTKTITTKMHSLMFPLSKNNRFHLPKGLVQNEINMTQDETRQVLVDTGVSSNKEVFEKQADSFGRECTDGEHSVNHHTDTECSTANREDTQTPESFTSNGLNLQLLPLTSTSSPQPEKSSLSQPIAHHLTPVSRPKTQNHTTSATNNRDIFADKLRNHASSLVSIGKRRTVNFFYKGRVTPRISIHSFERQPIIFTRLGKLGPILDKTTAYLPFSYGSRVDSQKMTYAQNTQTSCSTFVSLASVATQTEAIEAPCMTTEVQSQFSMSQRQVNVLSHNTLHMGDLPVSPAKQARNEENGENFSRRESDECSENMFAEAFKRTKSLSLSDNENEMAERKRRKVSSLDIVNSVPVSLMPLSVEPSPRLANEVHRELHELNTDEVAACKTVVMESDPDSDEEDILTSTPPRPAPPNRTPCKRMVFTCSGIPRPQVKLIEHWAQRIGAEVSQTYNSSVTHVIVYLDDENCAQRTLKFLYGVASGIWIVGVDWVHKCIRENRVLDEEPFEALDMDGEDGPRRARQTSQKEKLFEAFEFCCQGPFTDVTVDQLNQLLHLCGAATAPSPSQLTKRRRYTMIVIQTEDDVNLEIERTAVDWFNRHKVVSVSREWVLDCLAAYQLLPVLNQFIGKYSVSVLKLMGFDARLGV
ncbi:hypothetical protein OUZ56_018322 [Daphnia magna]|uniref:Breast cancer type 1 susceptibility protein n=1 Tax=Daphnia magna TaxID=35525 RepID=A0ABQ9Z8N6_9CRUS|nr:hypothetical protein OUZ56_018322 [Daphnia magna]